jgi:hypothetical protein
VTRTQGVWKNKKHRILYQESRTESQQLSQSKEEKTRAEERERFWIEQAIPESSLKKKEEKKERRRREKREEEK